jgi:hypothetical protein
MTMLLVSPPAAAQDKQPPYWASIASGEAMMRKGPGRNYPGTWLYKRRDLPVRVLKLYPNWRLIEDPDGARGWMLVTLLSDRRTAIVKKGEPRPGAQRWIGQRPSALSRRAGRRRPHRAMPRRLVPRQLRQARGLYTHERHLGRRTERGGGLICVPA